MSNFSSSARLNIMLAALLMSTGGAAIKACISLSSWQVACFRAGTAAVVLLLVLPAVWRGFSRRTLAVGCAYAAASVLFVLATKLTTAANAIFLQSTSPITIVLLSTFLLKEPLRREDGFFMLALAAGLSLFFFGGHHPTASAPNPPLGNLLALLSGLFWAFTLIGLRWLTHSKITDLEPGAAAVTAGCLIACAVTLPWAVPVSAGRGADLLTVLYLGGVGVALVFILLSRAMNQVTAIEAGLLLLIEPVLNPLWSWLLHGEPPGVPALVGGGIILAVTAIHTCWKSRSCPSPSCNPVPPSSF